MIEEIKKMPKVVLHLHLDGSISIEDAKRLSNLTTEELKERMIAGSKCQDLTEYLTKFDFPISLMQTKDNLEFLSKSLVDSLVLDNVVYAEVRFAPIFHTKEGLSLDDVVTSVLKGLNSNLNIKVNLILCLMRGVDKEDNLETLNIAYKYLNNGVCAIDLAGDEKLYLLEDYSGLFDIALKRNIPFTIHAGEMGDAFDVLKAINLGAKRIGHGIHAMDDDGVVNLLRERDVLLEVCPTSNVQTNAVDDYEAHPIKYFFESGVRVCVNTDNNTVSNISLTEEYIKLYDCFNFKIEDFRQMNIYAIESAFISDEEKKELLEKI